MAFLRQSMRRGLGVGAAAIVFVLLAGATYQGVATALERREFPRPGGLVNVGDHQLHIYCTGTGVWAQRSPGPTRHGWIIPASPWLARTGVLRAGWLMSSKPDGLPGGGALHAFLNRPDHLSRAATELNGWSEAVRLAAEVGTNLQPRGRPSGRPQLVTRVSRGSSTAP